MERYPKLIIFKGINKASLSKYKKIETIPCILSDHNALKLESTTKTRKQLETEQHIAQ
jgi:hypothetical protein